MMVIMDERLLDRELYDEALAAHVLGVHQSTLHYWLEGGERRGKLYEPVLRARSTGSKTVTWGESVEARYLREYRRTHGVALQQLRLFINFLREELGIAYPLASARPWVGPGRHLLIKAQEESKLPLDYWPAIVEPHSGQAMLLPGAERFLTRVEFDDEEQGAVIRVFPAGKESPVVIDPEVRYGTPTVAGIPTESIAEQVRAGDTVESVARDNGLLLDAIVAALDYERSNLPLAA